MEQQTISQCPICLQLPKNVVESLCCHHLFCEICFMSELQRRNKICCYCKQQGNYKTRPDLQKEIDETIVKCTNFDCKLEIKNKDYENHINKLCGYIKLKCNYCKKLLFKNQYIKHGLNFHAKQLERFLTSDLVNFEISKTKIVGLGIGYEPTLHKINRTGRLARRGTTGRFYCGQHLKITECTCNGYCGPNNGCQCIECMILDLQSQNIQEKGFLINSRGSVCKVEHDQAYCGIRLLANSNNYCSPDNLCGACKQLTKGIKRYKDLF